MLSVRTAGFQNVQRKLQGVVNRCKDKRVLFEDAGRYMVGTHIPQTFRSGGPGWPTVARGGQPLLDTGRLRDSITAKPSDHDLTVGTNLIYAGVQQRGGTILPKRGRYLALPCSPPLTVSERRTKRPRDFAGAWVMHGPQGLGIYRKTGSRGRGRGVEMIFRLVPSVTIKARPFLRFTREALQVIVRRWERLLLSGAA